MTTATVVEHFNPLEPLCPYLDTAPLRSTKSYLRLQRRKKAFLNSAVPAFSRPAHTLNGLQSVQRLLVHIARVLAPSIRVMQQSAWPSDMTDEEWGILEPLIPAPQPGGRPATYTRRDILDAMFYVKRGGTSWRMLPADFPYWKTVYDYFSQWRDDGTYERVNDALRSRGL